MRGDGIAMKLFKKEKKKKTRSGHYQLNIKGQYSLVV